MNKFTDKIEERLREIAELIPSAKLLEKRYLQKERSDLEKKLRKVTSW